LYLEHGTEQIESLCLKKNMLQASVSSLLTIEGKIFFSIIAQRLSTYLLKNGFIDTSVQKAGIQGCASIAWTERKH